MHDSSQLIWFERIPQKELEMIRMIYILPSYWLPIICCTHEKPLAGQKLISQWRTLAVGDVVDNWGTFSVKIEQRLDKQSPLVAKPCLHRPYHFQHNNK